MFNKCLKSLQKVEAHLEPKQAYDGAFLWIYLTEYTYYFCNKSSIIDVRCSIKDVRLGLRKY